MSSKEKVLAIRPEAVCIEVDPIRPLYQIKNEEMPISAKCLTKNGAWAAAYKYLTK
jgi:hypothetical protein